MSTPDCGNEPLIVITRSFDDKPTAVPMVGKKGNVIVVGNPKTTGTTGFPARGVFQYDESLFWKMLRAYENGKRQKLSELWNSASRFQPLDT